MSLPSLTTRRLVLRPLEKADAALLAALGARDFEIVRWMTSASWPYEEGEAEAYVDKVVHADPISEEAAFAITLGGVFIGTISLKAPGDLSECPDSPTLGYWIGRPFQGFGYAVEAARAVLEWGFRLHDTATIAARAFEDNAASRAILRKLGFQPVGKTVRHAKAIDRDVTCVVVELTRQSFEAAEVAA